MKKFGSGRIREIINANGTLITNFELMKRDDQAKFLGGITRQMEERKANAFMEWEYEKSDVAQRD